MCVCYPSRHSPTYLPKDVRYVLTRSNAAFPTRTGRTEVRRPACAEGRQVPLSSAQTGPAGSIGRRGDRIAPLRWCARGYPGAGLGEGRHTASLRCVQESASRGGICLDTEETAGSPIFAGGSLSAVSGTGRPRAARPRVEVTPMAFRIPQSGFRIRAVPLRWGARDHLGTVSGEDGRRQVRDAVRNPHREEGFVLTPKKRPGPPSENIRWLQKSHLNWETSGRPSPAPKSSPERPWPSLQTIRNYLFDIHPGRCGTDSEVERLPFRINDIDRHR